MKQSTFLINIPSSFFEGTDYLELYRAHFDGNFPIDVQLMKEDQIALFHGSIPLDDWLQTKFPLPAIPVSFWGDPTTDFFPETCNWKELDDEALMDILEKITYQAQQQKSWAVIIKDLPLGHSIEPFLLKEGFLPVDHEPIWYMKAPENLESYLAQLSKVRRKGLKTRWRKFCNEVRIRLATSEDIGFIKKSYDNVWNRASMRLEKLTEGFFSAALVHPNCQIFIFEKSNTQFAFVMLWKKDNVWFDKYMGTDETIYREMSFYSMSILYLLQLAPDYGIDWYVAGQGAGKEKHGLRFIPIQTQLWIKPLPLRWLTTCLLKRFLSVHDKRVQTFG